MNFNKYLIPAGAVIAIAFGAMSAAAQDHRAHSHGSAPAKAIASTEARELTNAEVRKIDKNAKKITLRHEPIKNLDMPSMTMVFQVADAALLDKVQVGDKVKFAAKQEGNAYVVTELLADK